MELSVLLARNAKQFIHGARKDTAQEDNQLFLNNLLGLGLTVNFIAVIKLYRIARTK